MWNGGWIDSVSLDNVRDLGGMPTQDGRQIRGNRLLRAGALSGAGEEDIAILREHQVRTIVDLRGDEEISRSPDPVIEGIRYIKNPILPSRTLGITHEEDMMQTAKKTYHSHEHMMDVYGMLVQNERALSRYKQFFGYVLDQKEGAILWHCTAGKDRTGTAAVLLQMALGVPQDIVMQDYLYTNVCLKKTYDEIMAQVLIQTDNEDVIRSASDMMLAKEEFLQTFLTGMLLAEGSIDAFLEKRLGLDEKTREQLQDMYLE